MTNPTVITGNSLTQTINGNSLVIIVNGNDDTINLNGQTNTITLNGTSNALVLDGSGGSATTNGNTANLSIIGNNNTIAANGTGDLVALDGSGNMLTAGTGAIISLASGAHATIDGGADTVKAIGGAALTFNGSTTTLSITGASNTATLNGDSETVTLAAAAQTNTVTVNGQSAKLTIAGTSNSVTVNGTGETLTVSGANNAINVNGASGNTVTLSSTGNVLTTAGTAITFANSSSGTVDGGDNTVTIGASDTVTVNGSGFTVKISGDNSVLDYAGSYGFVTALGSSDTVNISGGYNTVTQGGSTNTVIISGLGERVAVSGTGQILQVNNATISVAANTVLAMNTGGAHVYGNGNIVNVAANATVNFTPYGTNNWVQAVSGDTLTLAGAGDGVGATGTGNTLAFSAAGEVAQVNSSTLSLATGASVNLTGASNTIKLAANATLVLTGSGNAISGTGSSDNITISGSSDTVAINSGSISFTGAGNTASVQGTGFGVNGIAFPSDTLGAYNNAAATASLAALKATGANSTELVVTEYVANTTASTISTSNGAGLQTESDTNLIAEIKQATADGLSVFLAPHINIDDGTWQALLKPSNIAGFFTAYQAFIVHYATLAQANGVFRFSVGDELSGLQGSQYTSYWTTLIAAVRQAFKGEITYDSAWNATGTVSFWSQLDDIGANAYVPVTDNITNPTLAQLVSGWTTVNPLDSSVTGGVSAIQFYKNLSAEYGKPVLFTEAGYQSINGTNLATGAIPAPGASYTDYQQQALADQALFEALNQNNGTWFKGLYLWDWNPQSTAVQTDDFSPQGKPALAVVDAWYQGTEPKTTGAQSGSLTGNNNKVGLGNAVTLTLSGTGNVIVLGTGDVVKASGGINSYDATSSQLAGETITGGGSDTLVVTTAGTLAATAFAHITGIVAIDLAAGTNNVTLSDALVASATGTKLTVISGATGTSTINASAVTAAHSVTLTAGAGNATLTGGLGADTLVAGAGLNTLTGNGGADTYIYGNGDGLTTVINSTTAGIAPHGTIAFSSGVTNANLWFIQSGNNLEIDIIGSKSQLTVSDWFGTNKSAAASEITAGGLEIDTKLTSLIGAMATYQAANPSFNPQTATAMPSNTALQSAIKADWHSI